MPVCCPLRWPQENSEAPDAKRGGDIGWIAKGKVEPRLEAVALTTPRGQESTQRDRLRYLWRAKDPLFQKGACSPAFLERPGCFQMVYVEDRGGFRVRDRSFVMLFVKGEALTQPFP